MIGLGLNDQKDITLKGLEAVKKSKKVFLESYTSRLNCSVQELEKLYEQKIILADRELVESKADKILDSALKEDVSFLVIGDVFSATTHTDLYIRALEKGIKLEVINNASILNAIGIVGLELYKFGKTTSIVFPLDNWKPETHYNVLKENQAMDLHTLALLDIKVKEPSPEDIKKGNNNPLPERYMTVNEGIRSLLDIEEKRREGIFTLDTFCIGCARIGSKDFKIIAGTAKELLEKDFGEPLHCLIIPSKNLHDIEREMIEKWK